MAAVVAGRGALRITGGRLRGRRLQVPRGAAIRPTADRVRESLFARLGDLEGAAVLDLFAGTGALGIEALSRGAASAVFVDASRAALASVARNLEALELASRCRLLRADAGAAVGRLAREGRRFDLVFLDPPYGAAVADRALLAVARGGLLSARGTLVLETSWRHPPGDPPGLVRVDERRYGETLVVWYASEERMGSGTDSGTESGPEGGAG